MTRAEALRALRRAFAEAGLDTPALDARRLLFGALRIEGAEFAARPDEPLTPELAETLAAWSARRLAGEPVARILGEAEFWGLPFALSPETLVPRPDTETLVEAALTLFPDRGEPLSVLDLGTGSGCLLVAILHERHAAWGLGVDRSLGALRTARANARLNGVGGRTAFVQGNWAAAVRGPFDLLVSNPPYIATPVVGELDREVREHDPLLALDGGSDGLEAYRAILADAPRLLRPGGVVLLEIGYDQEEALSALSAGRPLAFLGVRPDLSGRPRCVALKRT